MPILCSSSLLSTIAILYFSIPCFAYTYLCPALLRQCVTFLYNTLLCCAFPLPHYAKPLFTLPKRINSFQFHNFALLHLSVPLRYITLLRFARSKSLPTILCLCFAYHNYNQPCRSLFCDFCPFETAFA